MKPPEVLCGVWNGLDYLGKCILPKGHSGAHKYPMDYIADRVLAHKPKPKSKPARKRARRAKKIAKWVA